jgi:hypothetical protein
MFHAIYIVQEGHPEGLALALLIATSFSLLGEEGGGSLLLFVGHHMRCVV